MSINALLYPLNPVVQIFIATRKLKWKLLIFSCIFFFYDHSSVCENLSKLFSLMNEKKILVLTY